VGDDFEVLSNIDFVENNRYRAFDASDRYLVWAELFFNSIFIYDLDSRDLIHEISLTTGQGPGEVESIMDVRILGDSTVVINDVMQSRIISININDLSINTISFPAAVAQRLIPVHDGYVFSAMSAPDGVVAYWDGQAEEANMLATESEDIIPEFANYMLRQGRLTRIGDKAVFSTKYLARHFIYDLSSMTFVKHIEYEVSEMDGADVVVDAEGRQMHVPPSQGNMLFHGSTAYPGSIDQIVMLLEGEGEYGSYARDVLYVYDIETEQFVDEIRLPSSAHAVVSNSSSVFIYSENDYTIYEYRPSVES
jgi:hypothetical protein